MTNQSINNILNKALEITEKIAKTNTEEELAQTTFQIGMISAEIGMSEEYSDIINSKIPMSSYCTSTIHPTRSLGYFLLGETYKKIPGINEKTKQAFEESRDYFKEAFEVQTMLLKEGAKDGKKFDLYSKKMNELAKDYVSMMNKQTLASEEVSPLIKKVNDLQNE